MMAFLCCSKISDRLLRLLSLLLDYSLSPGTMEGLRRRALTQKEARAKREHNDENRRRNESIQLLPFFSFLPTRDACSASAVPTASARASRSETSWILDRAARSLGPEATRGLTASASAFMAKARRERERERERGVKIEGSTTALSFSFRPLSHSLSIERKKE